MQTATPQAPRPGYPNPLPNEEPEGSGCGCYIKGCLITLLLAVVFVGAGGYFLWSGYKQFIQDYTATEPEDIPVVEIAPNKMRQLESRLEAFEKAIEAEPDLGEGGPDQAPGATLDTSPSAKPKDTSANRPKPMTLKLTANELNALIAKNPKYRGKVLTEITDGQIKAQVSLPIDDVPGIKDMPGVEGRFFNGTVGLEVAKNGSELVIRVSDAVLNGKPVPDKWMDSLRKENLAQRATAQGKTAEILRKIDSVEVIDDSIVIKLGQPEPVSP